MSADVEGTVTWPADGEVIVRWARVDVDDEVLASLARDLDEATDRRLARFVREVDRRRGTVAHALLRRTVGALLDTAPAEVRLGRRCHGCGSTEHGKPFVVPPPGLGERDVPQVNLSHSGDVVALALAPWQNPVGVDVEQIRPGHDWTPLRASVFTDAEWLVAQGADDARLARYAQWSAKEAALKVSGRGLSVPMRKARLTTRPGGWTCHVPGEEPVIVCPVVTETGYAAAVATGHPVGLATVQRARMSLT